MEKITINKKEFYEILQLAHQMAYYYDDEFDGQRKIERSLPEKYKEWALEYWRDQLEKDLKE